MPHGSIEWPLLHSVYDKDQLLDSHFQKAHKLTFRSLHPGDNKQNVSLALAVFDETTSAGILSYCPHREDSARFLALINSWWKISNAKFVINTNNYLGRALKQGVGKIDFLFCGWPAGSKAGQNYPHLLWQRKPPKIWCAHFVQQHSFVRTFWMKATGYLNSQTTKWLLGAKILSLSQHEQREVTGKSHWSDTLRANIASSISGEGRL